MCCGEGQELLKADAQDKNNPSLFFPPTVLKKGRSADPVPLVARIRLLHLFSVLLGCLPVSWSAVIFLPREKKEYQVGATSFLA